MWISGDVFEAFSQSPGNWTDLAVPVSFEVVLPLLVDESFGHVPVGAFVCEIGWGTPPRDVFWNFPMVAKLLLDVC